jgi:hypothetical protein
MSLPRSFSYTLAVSLLLVFGTPLSLFYSSFLSFFHSYTFNQGLIIETLLTRSPFLLLLPLY